MSGAYHTLPFLLCGSKVAVTIENREGGYVITEK
jgi:hypothetical protein